VRLMPPAYVKPYVKRQKNDMADAEAICEAVTIALPVTAMRGRMTLNSVNLEGFCRAWAIDEARK
jgi:transposase